MDHNIYIASTLSNAPRIRHLRDRLHEHKINLTYDWTEHNSGVLYVPDDQPDLKRQIAEKEIIGVCSAELILMVLPGGGGTHFEFGLAFGLCKPIVILDDDPSRAHSPCFYYLKDVVCCSTEDVAIITVLDTLAGRRKNKYGAAPHLMQRLSHTWSQT